MQEPPAAPARRKSLRLLLLVLLGFEAVYLLAANVFLNTEFGPRAVNRKPEKWTLTWDGGWSILPTRCHLRRPVFDRYGRRYDIHAEARDIRFRIRLLPLVGRRFVAHGLEVDGLSMGVDRRPEEAVREPRPDKPPGWRFALEDFGVDSVDSFRVEGSELTGGECRAGGAFEAQVRGEMALEGATLTWSDAVLRQDGGVLAEPLTVQLDGGFSGYVPRQEAGWELVRHIVGRIQVEGDVSSLSVLQRLFAGVDWIETLDGHGHLRADLMLDQGWIKPGSELVADAESLRLDFLGYATEGSGRVRATVTEGEGEEGPLRLAVVFDDFTVRRKPAEVPNVRGQGFQLVATTSKLDLRDGLGDLKIVIDMPRAEVPDVGVYAAYLPADLGLTLDSGQGFARLHLEGDAAAETASGFLELDAEKVAGSFQDLAFETGVEVRTRVSGGDLDDFRLEIAGTQMKLLDGVFRDHRNTREEGWWMDVNVPRGTAHLGGDTPGLEAEIELTMRDTRVIIAMFAELKSWLQHFERILTVKDVIGFGRIDLRGQHLILRDLSIDGPELHGRAELEMSKERHRGIFYLSFHGLAVGLERRGAEQDWKLTGVRPWYDRRVAESWRE